MTRRIDDGFTLIELLITVAIVGIVGAIAVPGLLRARASSDEASAVGSLRAINSGQASYSSSCAGGGYATTLADLFKGPVSGGAGFISPDLRYDPSVKSGYTFALEPDPAGTKDVGTASATCNASAVVPKSSYLASGAPLTLAATGTRYFGTDSRGTIFEGASAFAGRPIPSTATPVK